MVSPLLLCGPALCSWLLYSQIFSSLPFSNASCLRCFESSVIVPAPKKAKPAQLSYFSSFALTSIVMKVFERLVLNYLKPCTNDLRDPLQFAYRSNRSVQDAVALSLHHTLGHLEHPCSYARLLFFLDFSSAFNMIIPQKLFDKLLQRNVHPSLCHWIRDFLLDRRQVVKVNGLCSGPRVLNTGAPQGCVLSPLLFTLFTYECVSSDPSVLVAKFSDDTTDIGLISGDDKGGGTGGR